MRNWNCVQYRFSWFWGGDALIHFITVSLTFPYSFTDLDSVKLIKICRLSPFLLLLCFFFPDYFSNLLILITILILLKHCYMYLEFTILHSFIFLTLTYIEIELFSLWPPFSSPSPLLSPSSSYSSFFTKITLAFFPNFHKVFLLVTILK